MALHLLGSINAMFTYTFEHEVNSSFTLCSRCKYKKEIHYGIITRLVSVQVVLRWWSTTEQCCSACTTWRERTCTVSSGTRQARNFSGIKRSSWFRPLFCNCLAFREVVIVLNMYYTPFHMWGHVTSSANCQQYTIKTVQLTICRGRSLGGG